MTHLNRTRDILRDLIAFPTVSADPNLDMMGYIADLLDAHGARVDLIHDATGRKCNLFASLGPEIDGGVMLSGHSDVVPVTDQDWSRDPWQMWEEDARLYGRGACDMKGFIAATLALAPSFTSRNLRRPIHFAFTHDEEVGCLGAQSLVDALRDRDARPSVAIVGEPTMMGVIEGHKGCCEYTTRFTGLEGHGSAPDLGVNAVLYAVRYVNRLMQLAEEMKSRAPAASRFNPPWTTVNVGRLAGGVAHNVIPGKAELDWEMRPVQDADARHIKGALEDLVATELLPEMRRIWPEADITTETIGEVVGLHPVKDNAARHLIAELTGANSADVVPFGTEAGLFQSLGMSVVVCGPGSIAQAHKPDEFVALDQLSQCLTMLERLGQSCAA
ncbi:acetylornithine deacetylase [Primorskyibacter sedentarius]|uniref:Acetylornithine deacetylase n=1 Tax=Primorskyibacter sedentarius TaxID=745311 RepID=A0A4R3J3N9_9RHOB|nr:acetylornithine deacetylase [Primorskyibacter sedentarius]TCS60459.1 acetylornithine deacetylase [Primorskyibacter sedentarius]